MCCTLNAGGERKGRVAVSAGVSCTVTRAAPVPETEQAGEQTRHTPQIRAKYSSLQLEHQLWTEK